MQIAGTASRLLPAQQTYQKAALCKTRERLLYRRMNRQALMFLKKRKMLAKEVKKCLAFLLYFFTCL